MDHLKLKTEAAYSFEVLVCSYESAGRYNPQQQYRHPHGDNLKFLMRHLLCDGVYGRTVTNYVRV
jgi:hypothetical protein